jgi:hypothetical protein
VKVPLASCDPLRKYFTALLEKFWQGGMIFWLEAMASGL